VVLTSEMTLCAGKDGAELELNDWSFSQLCRMAGVAKDTINRLSHKTASRALQETLPQSEKPMQILTTPDTVRSVHGVAYTRLWNVDLLDLEQTRLLIRQASRGPGFRVGWSSCRSLTHDAPRPGGSKGEEVGDGETAERQWIVVSASCLLKSDQRCEVAPGMAPAGSTITT
jgi:hypothetical protein